MGTMEIGSLRHMPYGQTYVDTSHHTSIWAFHDVGNKTKIPIMRWNSVALRFHSAELKGPADQCSCAQSEVHEDGLPRFMWKN